MRRSAFLVWSVALRRYLAKTRHWYTHSPPHSWRLLVETPHRAVFGRGDLSKGFVEVGPGECASGKSQNERLEAPLFREANGARRAHRRGGRAHAKPSGLT
jgi:hypothetical protein